MNKKERSINDKIMAITSNAGNSNGISRLYSTAA